MSNQDQEGGTYSVGALADLAHVSVRTLHHYDAIGLLTPSVRTPAGHRRYSTDDLARLHQILVYRALDLGLDAIAEMLADPDLGTLEHLRRQRALLRQRVDRDTQLLGAVELEMEAPGMGMDLTPHEQFAIFGTDKVGGEWAEEAHSRWGETDAFRESQRRATHYSKQDWIEIKSGSDATVRRYADVMTAGFAPTSDEAMGLAEANRLFICERFYDCDHAMQRNLAEMYVSDDRFRATYDSVAPGLAQYVHDAIVANADAHDA